MKNQNILLVHNYYQIPGGEDTVVKNEKEMLEKHGYNVVLYSRNNSELKDMNKIQKLLLPFSTIFNIKTYLDINKIIKKDNINIVHVHNTLNLISASVYYAARRCNVPVIQTIHNFRLLCPGATFYREQHICEDCVVHGLWCAVKHNCYRGSKLQTLACVISTKIHRLMGIYGKINYICLTEFNRKKLLQFKQIKEERVFVKPNYVNSSRHTLTEKKNNQFIYVGRLDKLKGIEVVFEAWNQMGDDAPKLVVCGTGPMENWCKEYIQNRKINIELKGFIPNDEAINYISNSAALILPTQWYEGFPMTIVEAFSVGTAVICSDLGNAGSIVEEGITGYKFEAKSVEGLVAAIDRFEKKPIPSSNIKKIYEEKYSENINYEILKNIYCSVV